MKKKTTTPRKRGYSRAFTPRSDNHGAYFVSRIPAELWRQVKAKSKRDGVSIRAVILNSLATWSNEQEHSK